MRRGKREKIVQQPKSDPVETRYVITKGIPVEIPVPQKVEAPIKVKKGK